MCRRETTLNVVLGLPAPWLFAVLVASGCATIRAVIARGAEAEQVSNMLRKSGIRLGMGMDTCEARLLPHKASKGAIPFLAYQLDAGDCYFAFYDLKSGKEGGLSAVVL